MLFSSWWETLVARCPRALHGTVLDFCVDFADFHSYRPVLAAARKEMQQGSVMLISALLSCTTCSQEQVQSLIPDICRKGNVVQVVKLLAKFKRIPCFEAVYFLAACQGNRLDLVQALDQAYGFHEFAPLQHSGHQLILVACRSGFRRLAQWLMTRFGFDHIPTSKETSSALQNILSAAIEGGNLKLVKSIYSLLSLQLPLQLPLETDAVLCSNISRAAKRGHWNVLYWLLSRSSGNPEFVKTAFCGALSSGNFKIIKRLVQRFSLTKEQVGQDVTYIFGTHRLTLPVLQWLLVRLKFTRQEIDVFKTSIFKFAVASESWDILEWIHDTFTVVGPNGTLQVHDIVEGIVEHQWTFGERLTLAYRLFQKFSIRDRRFVYSCFAGTCQENNVSLAKQLVADFRLTPQEIVQHYSFLVIDVVKSGYMEITYWLVDFLKGQENIWYQGRCILEAFRFGHVKLAHYLKDRLDLKRSDIDSDIGSDQLFLRAACYFSLPALKGLHEFFPIGKSAAKQAFFKSCRALDLDMARWLQETFRFSRQEVRSIFNSKVMDDNVLYQACRLGRFDMARWLVCVFSCNKHDIPASYYSNMFNKSLETGNFPLVKWMITHLKVEPAELQPAYGQGIEMCQSLGYSEMAHWLMQQC